MVIHRSNQGGEEEHRLRFFDLLLESSCIGGNCDKLLFWADTMIKTLLLSTLMTGILFSGAFAQDARNTVVAELKLQGSNSGLIRTNDSFRLGRIRLRDEIFTYINDPAVQSLLEIGDFTFVKEGDEGRSYRITLGATDIDMPMEIVKDISDKVVLPTTVDFALLEAVVTLSEPWNLLSAQNNKLQLTEISVEDASLVWGDVSFSATGEVQVSSAGLLKGSIMLNAPNWRDALALFIFDTEEQRDAMDVFISGFADGNHLDVPLDFAAGNIKIGPFVIAEMPPLRLP